MSSESASAFSELPNGDPRQAVVDSCEDLKRRVLERSALAGRLLQAIQLRSAQESDSKGCSLTCAICEGSHAPVAAFVPSHGIVLCANAVDSEEEMECNLSHELVHAYDAARQRLDLDNPDSLACSEVRAARLSGECDGIRAFLKHPLVGPIEWAEEQCVRESAVESTALRFGEEKAREAVTRVYANCVVDEEPLEKHRFH